jgi:hypothetical protein
MPSRRFFARRIGLSEWRVWREQPVGNLKRASHFLSRRKTEQRDESDGCAPLLIWAAWLFLGQMALCRQSRANPCPRLRATCFARRRRHEPSFGHSREALGVQREIDVDGQNPFEARRRVSPLLHGRDRRLCECLIRRPQYGDVADSAVRVNDRVEDDLSRHAR